MNNSVRQFVFSLFIFSSFAYADIERVSVSSSGEQSNNSSGIHSTGTESVSADGRFVAFTSAASNLVPDDTNGINDIYVRDRQAGITERVSVSSTGEQATGEYNASGSQFPTIQCGRPLRRL